MDLTFRRLRNLELNAGRVVVVEETDSVQYAVIEGQLNVRIIVLFLLAVFEEEEVKLTAIGIAVDDALTAPSTNDVSRFVAVAGSTLDTEIEHDILRNTNLSTAQFDDLNLTNSTNAKIKVLETYSEIEDIKTEKINILSLKLTILGL